MTQHSYFLIRFPLWRQKMYLDIDPVGWAQMSRLSLTFYTLTRCHASQLLFLNSKNVSTSFHCSIETHFYPKRYLFFWKSVFDKNLSSKTPCIAVHFYFGWLKKPWIVLASLGKFDAWFNGVLQEALIGCL